MISLNKSLAIRAFKIFFVGIFFISIIKTSASAQTKEMSFEKKMQLMGTIDSLIRDYETFGKFSETDGDSISKDAIYKYLILFENDNDEVFDDMCPTFFNKDYKNKIKLNDTTLSTYLKRVKDFYPQGFRQNINSFDIDYNNFKDNKCYVSLVKKTVGLSRDGYDMQCIDTLFMTIGYSDDLSLVRINKIALIGKADCTIQNDDDHDFVINKNDNCPSKPGAIKYHGCPPPDAPSICLGFSTGFLAANGNLGHPVGQLNGQGDISENASFFPTALNYFISGDIEYFLTRKRWLGFSLGAMYLHYNSTISLNEFNFSGTGADVLGPYSSVINATGIKEKIGYSFLMIPLMAQIQVSLGKRNNFFLKIAGGIAYSLLLPSTSEIESGNYTYGAIYKTAD